MIKINRNTSISELNTLESLEAASEFEWFDINDLIARAKEIANTDEYFLDFIRTMSQWERHGIKKEYLQLIGK